MKECEIIKYKISNNRYYIESPKEGMKMYYIEKGPEKLVKRLKSFLGHKLDLIKGKTNIKWILEDQNPYGKEYVNQILIDSTIQLLIKCYSSTKNNGRIQLNSNQVFNNFSNQKDHLIEYFNLYKDQRNQIISHDEKNYLDHQLYIVLNDLGEVNDLRLIGKHMHFFTEDTIRILSDLLDISINYCNEQINKVKEKIKQEFKNNKSEFKLVEIIEEK